jgi:hypothetical protein
MAAITPFANIRKFNIVRSAVGTSQTDWLYLPEDARIAIVRLAITTAGTNTILTISGADPNFRDDARISTLFTGATITAASDHEYQFNPAWGQAAGADSATADAVVGIPLLAPTLMGLGVAATGSTYTLTVEYRN